MSTIEAPPTGPPEQHAPVAVVSPGEHTPTLPPMAEASVPAAAPAVRARAPVRRLAWVLVAAALLAAGLWDGRAAFLPIQPTAQATHLEARIVPPSLVTPPVRLSRTTATLIARTPAVQATLDLSTGRLSLSWPSASGHDLTVSGFAGALLRGSGGSGPAGETLARDYAHHAVSIAVLRDRLGRGTRLTLSDSDPRYPPLRQQITLYDSGAGVVVRTSLGDMGGRALDVSRIDPLVVTDAAGIGMGGIYPKMVFAINGLSPDHMPRQLIALTALPPSTSLPYVTAFADPRGGAFLAGALGAAEWFPSVLLEHSGGAITALALTDTGPVSGASLTSEPFFIGRFADAAVALSTYASALGRVQPPPAWSGGVQLGWSSWGAFELAINEKRVLRNAAFMAAHLRSLGYDTVHIDDGWEQRYGDWVQGAGFPHGMGTMAAGLHRQGLKASIWYAPFIAVPESWPARLHPDWLLRNIDGSPVSIIVSGPTYVLDVTNPAVLAYIRAVSARIRGWGYDAVKLDFLYTGAIEGQRFRFDLNGMQAYTEAMAVVRDSLEADPHHPIYLTGVQQGFLPTGFFHAWRVGRDIESRTNADHLPTWDLVRREALAVNAFAFANGSVYATDPDDLLLRRVRGAQNLSADELQSYATMVALGGTLWLSGDDLPSLAAQGRLGYLTDPEVLDVVRSGRAGIPIGLADRLRGPAAVWLAPQSDGSAVVAFFNWGNHAQTVAVPLAAIGLRARTYTVRDLWARASLPSASGSLSFRLRPHQSYLVRLRKW